MVDTAPTPALSADDNAIEIAGDIRLSGISIIDSSGGAPLSIYGMFVELDIFEDIYSPFITGTVTMVDAFNLIDSMPMVGEERLLVSYQTPGRDILTKTFYIVKIDRRELQSDKKHIYVLHIVSEKAYFSAITKVSKAYAGSGTAIIKQIFIDHLQNSKTDILSLEESTNRFKFLPTFWEPMQCIAYAVSRCANISKGVNDFLFYETMGYHKLASYSTLMNAKAYTTLYFDKAPIRVTHANGSSSRDINREYATARRMEYISSIDTIRQIQEGTLRNVIYGFDIVRKSIRTNQTDYVNDFSKTMHLDKFPMHTKNMQRGNPGVIRTKVVAPSLFDGYSVDNTDASTSKRLALLGQLEMFKLNLDLPGRTDITVGMTINFDMPAYKLLDSSEDKLSKNLNKYYSGKYLITAIKHRITQSKHAMNMQIIKDSLASEIKFGEEI